MRQTKQSEEKMYLKYYISKFRLFIWFDKYKVMNEEFDDGFDYNYLRIPCIVAYL